MCLQQSFGLREYAASVDKAGLVLLSFPIIEMAASTCIHQTHHNVQQTAQLMAEGHHIAVHCRYGHQLHMDIAEIFFGQIPLAQRTGCTLLGSTCRHELFQHNSSSCCLQLLVRSRLSNKGTSV